MTKLQKTKLLNRAKLYVILDQTLVGRKDLAEIARRLVRGGADLVQYRDKISDDGVFLERAVLLRRIFKKASIPLIINDRLDVALEIEAEGIHLGQEDLPVRVARKLLGPGRIIGCSAEDIALALSAVKQGADYLGLGPIFHTTTKKIKNTKGAGLLRQAAGVVKIPYFAIGGIKLNNLGLILEAGCSKVAVASAILKSRDMALACQFFQERLRE